MNRLSLCFATGCLMLSAFVLPAAQASDHECSNNHYGDGLVGYSESREERLAASSMNDIDPGPNGSINVHGSNQSDILVRACIQTAAPSDSEARSLASHIAITQGTGKIRPSGPSRNHDHHWDISYEVWVPLQSNLNLTANNGSIALGGVDGHLRLRTTNGSVRLSELGGDVDGETTNGSVTIDLKGSRWNGHGLRMETTNGSVKVNVPENYSAQFEASTVNGGMHVDFPVQMSGEINKKDMSFQMGSGGPTISAKTVNGAVHISRRA